MNSKKVLKHQFISLKGARFREADNDHHFSKHILVLSVCQGVNRW